MQLLSSMFTLALLASEQPVNRRRIWLRWQAKRRLFAARIWMKVDRRMKEAIELSDGNMFKQLPSTYVLPLKKAGF